MKYSNVFYFYNINSIGGVEQFFYYLSKKYKDMVVFYTTGDPIQVQRLLENVETRKYKGEKIKCKRFFCNYKGYIIENVEADEYIQIIHANYVEQGLTPMFDKKINKYIAVSKISASQMKMLSKKDCEVIYNPIYLDEPKEPLLIVSATRLTKEKGKENIIKIGKKLNALGLPYLWLIFTNDVAKIDNPNIIYMKPRLDITGYLKKADIVAQLSSSESFCFTVNEALMLGTPILAMDLPIWSELGIKDGVHGWLIKNINTFDVRTLYNHIPKFKYEPPKSNWDKYLGEKGDYDPNKIIEVKGKRSYIDIKQGRKIKIGERLKLPVKRAYFLIDNDYMEVCDETNDNNTSV